MELKNEKIRKAIADVPEKPEVLTLDQLAVQFGSQLVEKFNKIKAAKLKN